MADVVSFACLHQSEESVHAQKDSFLKTMEKHATVIYNVLRENLSITWYSCSQENLRTFEAVITG